jgi:hypothetical protein
MPALVLEPEVEAGAAAKGQAVEQLMTDPGERHGLHPGARPQNLDVDEGSRGQLQVQGIPTDLHPLAQLATDHREGPAERPERVVGLGE